MNIYTGLLLVGICCTSNNACIAQQGTVGPDGLYLPPPETSLADQRVRKPANAKQLKPSPAPKATWQEDEAQQNADDDRLKRKMNICQRC